MRGHVDLQSILFSYFSSEERIPAEHPWWPIKAQANPVLTSMSVSFETMYTVGGWTSIAPELQLAEEHFTIGDTLIEAWASFKSFWNKDGEALRSGRDGTGRVDSRG